MGSTDDTLLLAVKPCAAVGAATPTHISTAHGHRPRRIVHMVCSTVRPDGNRGAPLSRSRHSCNRRLNLHFELAQIQTAGTKSISGGGGLWALLSSSDPLHLIHPRGLGPGNCLNIATSATSSVPQLPASSLKRHYYPSPFRALVSRQYIKSSTT